MVHPANGVSPADTWTGFYDHRGYGKPYVKLHIVAMERPGLNSRLWLWKTLYVKLHIVAMESPGLNSTLWLWKDLG